MRTARFAHSRVMTDAHSTSTSPRAIAADTSGNGSGNPRDPLHLSRLGEQCAVVEQLGPRPSGDLAGSDEMRSDLIELWRAFRQRDSQTAATDIHSLSRSTVAFTMVGRTHSAGSVNPERPANYDVIDLARYYQLLALSAHS
jgi:hypothetical protein